MSRYRVTGALRVWGRKKGQVFERALTVAQEQALIQGGHVVRLPDGPPPKRTRPTARRSAAPPIEGESTDEGGK